MKLTLAVFYVGLIAGVLAFSQMPAAAGPFAQYNLKVVNASEYESTCRILKFDQSAGLYVPHQAVGVTLHLPMQKIAEYSEAVIEIIPIDTRQIVASENGFVGNLTDPLWSVTSGVSVVRASLNYFVRQGENVSGTLPVPDTFGTYALVLVRGDGRRTMLGVLARIHQPVKRDHNQIPQFMAELTPRGVSMADAANADLCADVLAKLGVGLVRWELGWEMEERPGFYNWARTDAGFDVFHRRGIKVMTLLGSHPRWALPFGEPTPAARKEKPDHVGHPRFDDAFGKFVTEFSRRYYKGDGAGLWGIEHWNEPWEPVSISGWESDSNRYRQLLMILSRQAKAVSPEIKILGASSVMNTEDKLLSAGTGEWINQLDILTDHYVLPRNAYGPRVAEKWGKLSGETETWGANREVLLHQFMAQFLACGQSFLNPTTGDMLLQNIGSPKEPLWVPKPAIVAVSTWNTIIADRPFTRIAFRDHLPWLFQFGADDDARFVLFGRLLALATSDTRDLLWAQAASGPDGAMILRDPERQLEIFDSAGNQIQPDANLEYHLALSPSAYFLKSSGSAAGVIKQIRTASIEGLRHVEILPQSLTFLPQPGKPVPLTLQLHNLTNRALNGTLRAIDLRNHGRIGEPLAAKMLPGQTISLSLPIAQYDAPGMPIEFVFEPESGAPEKLTELVQYTGINYATPKTIQDWQRIGPVPVLQNSFGGDAITRAWLPFIKGEENKQAAQSGDIRTAWDQQNLYILASVDAKELIPKPRLEKWDQEQYFHNRESPGVDARYAEFAARKAGSVDFNDASYVYRKMLGNALAFSGDCFQIGFDFDAPRERALKTHDLRYPGDQLPAGYHAIPDTDYEFSIYQCEDGGTEIWCLLEPDMPRVHGFPRQLRGARYPHAEKRAAAQITHADGRTHYQITIPWGALGLQSPAAGTEFGMTFRFNSASGGAVEFGRDKAITKANGLSLHPYWAYSTSCQVRWVLR